MAIAQRNIDDTTIRAPFAGIIARKYADPGAFVTPTTAGSAVTSATSSSILALASTNEIVAQVAEASIAQIRVGQVAVIKVDAYSGKTFAGKVTQVATQSLVQQNVTSFEVKVAVADPEKLLSQGMNVTITSGRLRQRFQSWRIKSGTNCTDGFDRPTGKGSGCICVETRRRSGIYADRGRDDC